MKKSIWLVAVAAVMEIAAIAPSAIARPHQFVQTQPVYRWRSPVAPYVYQYTTDRYAQPYDQTGPYVYGGSGFQINQGNTQSAIPIYICNVHGPRGNYHYLSSRLLDYAPCDRAGGYPQFLGYISGDSFGGGRPLYRCNDNISLASANPQLECRDYAQILGYWGGGRVNF